jgi:NADH-quinone oxidoreductase subunit E
VVDQLRSGETVTATRGARVCTWRESERVLAGFSDNRADEGPTAAAESLLGLRIAAEKGWSAPPVPGRDQAVSEESGREGEEENHG